MLRRSFAAAAVAVGVLAFTATAGAETLGISTPPVDTAGGTCFPAVVAQYQDDPSTPFLVPTGGGQITQWETYAGSDDSESSISFVVLRPSGSSSYTVVGVDTETIPSSLPVSGIASFTLAQPISVEAGDTLGLFSATATISATWTALGSPRTTP